MNSVTDVVTKEDCAVFTGADLFSKIEKDGSRYAHDE